MNKIKGRVVKTKRWMKREGWEGEERVLEEVIGERKRDKKKEGKEREFSLFIFQ